MAATLAAVIMAFSTVATVAPLAAPLTDSVIDAGFRVPLPPKEFRGDNIIIGEVFFGAQETVDLYCGGHGDIIACARFDGSRMVLPNACQPEFRGQQYADIVCHELGHPNGWGADGRDHPNAVYEDGPATHLPGAHK